MFGASLVGTQLQKGRYKITAKLDKGGIGETYLAEDTSKIKEKQCVVKRLLPQQEPPVNEQEEHQRWVQRQKWVQQKFEQEAEMLESLGKHDQIPALLAYFQEDREFFVIQEFVQGNNLRKDIYPGGQWNEHAVTYLLRDILEVLEFIHQKGVIHRDIKPENLMLRQSDKKIVVIDFGAVKEVTSQVINTQGQVVINSVIGTPGYMPVEQLRGQPLFCSDIYAVGMIAIEALTGVFPLQLATDPNTSEVVWRNKVQISNNLANVLETMVRFQHQQRYQSASEALQAVHNLLQTIPVSRPPYQQPPPPLKPADFGRRLVAYLIDISILALGSLPISAVMFGSVSGGGWICWYVVLGFIYCPVMESSPMQGTLGKMAVGIIVTDLSGNKIDFEQAIKRHSSKLLSYLFVFIGFLMGGFTEKRRTLHDRLSGCLVIRKQ
ncbi:MAG: protein kinase [Microcoleus sp. SU_5_3]|nr:protein kinase [Microcoleus sp. SU_5_3]